MRHLSYSPEYEKFPLRKGLNDDDDELSAQSENQATNIYILLEWSLFQELLSMVCLMQYRKAIEIMHYSWMESSAPDKQRSNILNNIDNCIIL